MLRAHKKKKGYSYLYLDFTEKEKEILSKHDNDLTKILKVYIEKKHPDYTKET